MINQKISFLSIFLIFSLLISSINTEDVYPITDSVKDDSNYKKADFTLAASSELGYYYFKYSASTVPSSRIGAFRFDLGSAITDPEILCVFVSDSSTDQQIIDAFDSVEVDTSVCVGAFNGNGVYDGIFKYDESKKLLAFLLKTKVTEASQAHVYVRNAENKLESKEQNVNDNSLYSFSTKNPSPDGKLLAIPTFEACAL